MKNKAGFTLIEICIVMAILVLFLSLATPSFIRMMRAHVWDKETKEISLLLEQARRLSAREQKNIILNIGKDKIIVRDSSDVLAEKEFDSVEISSSLSEVLFEPDSVPQTVVLNLSGKNNQKKTLVMEPFVQYVFVQ